MVEFRLWSMLAAGCISAFLIAGLARAESSAMLPAYKVELGGAPELVFSPVPDGCDVADVPDVSARALRDAQGEVSLFMLHDTARAMRGPDLEHVKKDCRVALDSHSNADPAAFDDRSWISALWSEDGKKVSALVHHEYQGNEHPGHCSFKDYMSCWYNSVLEVQSQDGGISFHRPADPVVAAVPFKSDENQGHHRGFFNPSNIIKFKGAYWFYASTTGWLGQEGGVCLFRSEKPDDPQSWRAFDGRGFNSRFADPYRRQVSELTHCQIIEPFPAWIGSVSRLKDADTFLAVFQAKRDQGPYPLSGFYTATSHDLIHWSAPQLLMVGATLFDDPCRSNGRVISYPAILDPTSQDRNFEDVNERPMLYFASMKVSGCDITHDRILLRMPLKIMPVRRN